MSHLWVPMEVEVWGVLLLSHRSYTIPNVPHSIPHPDDTAAGHDSARLLRVDSQGAQQWILIVPAGLTFITINGYPLLGGAAVLADKDEICLSKAGRFYFSTEELPVVEQFTPPHNDQPTRCPRCRQEILTGTDAVRCPKCALYYHSSADTPCWTYSAFCICGRSTALEAKYEWVPHEL